MKNDGLRFIILNMIRHGMIVMSKKKCDWTAMVVKDGSTVALKTAARLLDDASRLGETIKIPLQLEPKSPLLKNVPRFDFSEEKPCRVIVIGGDGTLLRLLQYEELGEAVIATIGAGRRCYFFDIDNTEIEGILDRLLRGDYVEHRMWRLRINACGEFEANALNEVALVGDSTKIMRLNVMAGTRKIYEFTGDGVIVATTQGSTAYSLSAGGPIVDPLLTSMVITPINSTMLHIRPIVVEPYTTIKIGVPEEKRFRILIDGIGYGGVPPGCIISVRISEKPVRVARFRWVRFYEKLF